MSSLSVLQATKVVAESAEPNVIAKGGSVSSLSALKTANVATKSMKLDVLDESSTSKVTSTSSKTAEKGVKRRLDDRKGHTPRKKRRSAWPLHIREEFMQLGVDKFLNRERNIAQKKIGYEMWAAEWSKKKPGYPADVSRVQGILKKYKNAHKGSASKWPTKQTGEEEGQLRLRSSLLNIH
jgi:hypothetical protein